MENLFKVIRNSISLKPDAEKYLKSISKIIKVPKDSILIREGQVVNKTYFVIEGCLRSYCIDKNAKEHTLQFAIKNWWMSDYIAIHTDRTAVLTIESISDATLIEFDFNKLNETLVLFPEFEEYQRKNLERHTVSLQKRILSQLQLTAAERYNLFIQDYKEIEQHAPNYHIASYLGITQESLSRIRAKQNN
jgi:CRP-like cAMP-binding protein